MHEFGHLLAWFGLLQEGLKYDGKSPQKLARVRELV
jgi:hypothetical protein